jgi:hypothetical protein
MSGGARTLRWAPPLLVGICGACAAEVAVGLLLYAGPGFMRSLTTVLAVEAGALGAGLWTAPSPRPDLVEAVRRRWMVCLVAFVIAALFSAFWSLVQTVGGSPLGQGLGLAFTAGLPLYSCGTVLGGLSSVEGSIASSASPAPAPRFPICSRRLRCCSYVSSCFRPEGWRLPRSWMRVNRMSRPWQRRTKPCRRGVRWSWTIRLRRRTLVVENRE